MLPDKLRTRIEPYRTLIDVPPEGLVVDFIGTFHRPDHMTDESFAALAVDKELYEWLDLFDSVEEAGDEFVFVELGAGYGRWAARAARAAQIRGISNFRLVMAEAEPTHIKWLHQHMRDNKIETSTFRVFEGAISSRVGHAEFYVSMPDGHEGNNPRQWYGQSLIHSYEKRAQGRLSWSRLLNAVSRPERQPATELESGWSCIRVPTTTVGALLQGVSIVDLVDMDIQGEERNIIRSDIETFDTKVRKLHIATHGSDIEGELRSLLGDHGWTLRRDVPCHSTHESVYGPIDFVDGVQTWTNVRFEGRSVTNR